MKLKVDLLVILNQYLIMSLILLKFLFFIEIFDVNYYPIIYNQEHLTQLINKMHNFMVKIKQIEQMH